MDNVNKKILWLADHDLDQAPGGAQRSDSIIISQGKLLGFNILKVTCKTISEDLNIHDYDILITSNIHALHLTRKNLIDEISKHKHHIRLEHDSNEYLSTEDRIKLFNSCVKTIFLSDFHVSFFKQRYGEIFKNIQVVYDPIDINIFKDNGQEREEKILYAGYMHPLKGSFEFFEYALNNPQQNFVIAGWTDNCILHHLSTTIPNIEYLGLKKYEEMPSIYNKYKAMFYDPNLNEPFCRSIAEAIMCGMFILTSRENRIGCMREMEKIGIDDFREKCSVAALKFWQSI